MKTINNVLLLITLMAFNFCAQGMDFSETRTYGMGNEKEAYCFTCEEALDLSNDEGYKLGAQAIQAIKKTLKREEAEYIFNKKGCHFRVTYYIRAGSNNQPVVRIMISKTYPNETEDACIKEECFIFVYDTSHKTVMLISSDYKEAETKSDEVEDVSIDMRCVIS